MKELYDENPEKVAGAIDELFKDEQQFKKMWAQQAKRNVSFANGDQTPYPTGAPIMVNNQPVNFVNVNDGRANMYQTNEIAPVVRTIESYMTRAKPSVDISPASQDQQDKNVARVAERVHEAKYDLDGELQNSKDSAFWAITTGNVFAKDFWDYSLGDYTYELDPETQEMMIDPETGEPVISDQKTGRNNTAILTALSVSVDHSVTNFKDQPYVYESYLMDVDWAREAFDRNAPGYTGKASKIQEDNYVADTMSILEDMKYAIPYVTYGAGNRPKSKGKCLIQEWYMKPNKTYGKGRMLIRAGGVMVFDTPPDEGSPYFMELEDIMWHPYTHFGYEPYVGRFLYKGLVEQIVPLQMRINELNGSFLENANTIAKPNIMAAIGQLKKGVMNGKGSNVYTYQNIPGTPPPFVLQAAPLPQQFFKEKQDLIDAIVRIVGTNFVMSGQPPTGVTAAQAIDMLLENANSQQSGLMLAWARYHQLRFTKKLRLIHKFNNNPDQMLERYLRTLAKDSLDLQIKDFIGTQDLSDGIVLKIQEGSQVPKSEAAKNKLYMDLGQQQMLGPDLQEDSPRGQKKRAQIMEKLGLEPLEDEESVEIKKAKWENDNLLRGKYIEVSDYDNVDIHLPCHIAKIQDPKFLETAKPEQYDMLNAHIQEHQQKVQQAQIEQQQAQMDQMAAQGMADPMNQPPPGPTGPPPSGGAPVAPAMAA